MEIKLTLALPHDEISVPVARHVLAGALRTLGVEESAALGSVRLSIGRSTTCGDIEQAAKALVEAWRQLRDQ